MPHCYFVNSHETVIGGPNDGIVLANEEERIALRMNYGIHPSAFVFCCHSRPDKIDPSTFRSWIKALCISRQEQRNRGAEEAALPVLWLLRSGNEMEQNLRSIVQSEFGDNLDGALVFADIAQRNEHLKRLGCADLFLDTPCYGAHTLGCDALFMGVPMVSLFRTDTSRGSLLADEYSDVNSEHAENRSIPTEKLASIVGASLLRAVSLEEFVVGDMQSYEDLMVKCAINREWFSEVRERLFSSRTEPPLFDTARWVRNLETAFLKMKELGLEDVPDIVVMEGDGV
jgi:protein O-GlcNAc transferase